MVSEAAAGGWQSGAWSLVVRLTATDGTAVQPWFQQLVGPQAARRDLADAVHALCILHGSYPGMADDALIRHTQAEAEDWLRDMASGFAGERAALAGLVAAAGPLPSTPGQARSETAFLGQRHALGMLAGSDRRGCATGAVAALRLDWFAVRQVLDHAARCFGVQVPAPQLPIETETAAVVAAAGVSQGAERAIAFGAQQLLAQHRGLWGLLEARAEARGRS